MKSVECGAWSVEAGTVAPEGREVIAAGNVGRLTELAWWERGVVQDVAFSADGEWIEVRAATGTYRHEGANLAAEPQLLSDSFLVVSPQGDLVAIQAADGTIQLWQGDTLVESLPESEGMQPVQFSAVGGRYEAFGLCDERWKCDGRLLATGAGSTSPSLQIRLAADGNLILALPYREGLDSLTFSGNGRYLAAGFSNGLIRVWGIP